LPEPETIKAEGVVTEALRDSNFRVQLENGHTLLATIAGRMRRFRIRVMVGDRVAVEITPYDLGRGRITFRHRK
jgi:translation initiation factor IF-1